ncbi:hypothetical protein Ocin01_03654 [Orchesella cincta]|uniref:Uncharacterized protein n=1 Tax=Orchesella cincta TaxID=48709 RepID=A0A1D2NCS0_ORCCI|nr:hypothetical protein Ocin01_03654 [Orchesella cincta]
MVDFKNVRWTFIAVIFLFICVQWTTAKAVYIGHERRPNVDADSTDYANNDAGENNIAEVDAEPYGDNDNRVTDQYHKHIRFFKHLDEATLREMKRRVKARMKGKKGDRSNERNLWTSHPKNMEWMGPDTDEVVGVINSLGI